MGKIRIRTGRGTGTIEVDEDASKWSGDEFRKIQEARKKATAGRMVHTGRGTGSRSVRCRGCQQIGQEHLGP